MRPRMVAVTLGVLVGCGGNSFARAQSILLTPSFTVGEEYDDNVRRTPTNRQSDFTTSLTPGLGLQLRDYPWSLTADGSVRGEFFARQSELNNFGDNASGNATVEYRPTPSFTASLSDTFVRSLNPFDVNPVTGLAVSRRSVSTRNTVSPALSYQINPLTTLRLRYSLESFRSDSPGSRDSDTQVAEASGERQLTPRDSALFRYTFSHFHVEGLPDENSHVPRLGIAHAFSPTIRASAEAGPLIRQGAGFTEVTAAGTLRYDQQFRQGSLSVILARDAQLAGGIGQAGVTESLTTTTNFPLFQLITLTLNSVISYTEASTTTPDLRVFSNAVAIDYQPLRSLSIGLQGTMSDNRSSGNTRVSSGAVDFVTYSAAIQVNYRILRWLSLQGGYRLERQEDRVGLNDLRRNVFFLRLLASDQFRVY